MGPPEDRRKLTLTYLVADIPEDLVLGLTWLRQFDPAISFAKGTWNWTTARPSVRAKEAEEKARRQQPAVTPVLKITARKARTRIIQGEIQANEPPEWVQKEFAGLLEPREQGTLPPHREGFDYEVRMKDSYKPLRERPRNFSAKEREMFKDLAKEQLAKGFWRVSKSPQCAQMLWAAKAGGEKRPCIDYRYINRHMINDAYPVPVIRQLMMDVAGSHHFTSLDLPAAYNEVRIKDQATREILAFQCADGQYEPEVMQFGSKTAVAWFQRFITHVLHRNIGKGVLAYLDNIIVYAKTPEEHHRLLREVLQDLQAEGLRVKPKKCEWFKSEVQFCGFMISGDGIRLDPEKLRAIKEWKLDLSLKESLKRTAVREFLGFCNFYKEHVDHYSQIAIPLTRLTGATNPWRWGQAEELAMCGLKEAIMLAPVLMAYDQDKDIEVFTDASDGAIAGVVNQKDDRTGKLRPLGFHSKKLNPAECNYTVHDKELLAIVSTFKKFRHWLHGTPNPVKVWSDHSALKHFLSTTKLTQRHARWAELLGEFRFEIRHLPGKRNGAADGLSRAGTHGKEYGGGARPLREKHFRYSP